MKVRISQIAITLLFFISLISTQTCSHSKVIDPLSGMAAGQTLNLYIPSTSDIVIQAETGSSWSFTFYSDSQSSVDSFDINWGTIINNIVTGFIKTNAPTPPHSPTPT